MPLLYVIEQGEVVPLSAAMLASPGSATDAAAGNSLQESFVSAMRLMQPTSASCWYCFLSGNLFVYKSDGNSDGGELHLGPFDFTDKTHFLLSWGVLAAGSGFTLKIVGQSGGGIDLSNQIMAAIPVSNFLQLNPGSFVGATLDTSAYSGQRGYFVFNDTDTTRPFSVCSSIAQS